MASITPPAPVSGLSGPLPGEHPAIHVYDLKERKDEVLLTGATTFTLSFDGSKLLYRRVGGGGEGDEDPGAPRPDLSGSSTPSLPALLTKWATAR